MGIIAEFSVEHPETVLEDTLSTVPEMELDLVSEIGTDPDRPVLFFWASGDDFETFEAAMADDPTVTNVEAYTRLADRVFYRIQITEATEVVAYRTWVEAGANQLEATYADGSWHNRFRFPDRDALRTVRSWAVRNGFEFDLHSVYAERPAERSVEGLTDEQETVLALARERGYFEIPRRASLADLAEELSLSQQSVSERLRRAHRTLADRHVG
jgi:predicted DNA binding protein